MQLLGIFKLARLGIFILPTLIAIAVVEHNDRVLIGQRPAKTVLGGLWEFPGGKIEAAETAADAAVRECREETGLEVSVVGEYPTHEQAYEHDCVQLRFFRCVPSDPLAAPLTPYRWVACQDLALYEFPAGNRTVLTLLSRPQRTD